jgi:hypothetical protein
MLDMPRTARANVTPRLFTYDEARGAAANDPLAVLAQWLTDYPMSGHADLGRTGVVCPFLRKAALLDTLRIGISPAGPADESAAFAMIRSSFAVMKRIPAPPGKDRLGTIVYGFPNCAGSKGLAMLGRIYKRHKYYTVTRGLMMAFFHADSDAHGLWNPDFRPMRSPIPVLGMRYMIEQDAVFAAKHHLLMPPYLLRFGPIGAQRLLACRRQMAASGARSMS